MLKVPTMASKVMSAVMWEGEIVWNIYYFRWLIAANSDIDLISE